jgi:hypothetical protein
MKPCNLFSDDFAKVLVIVVEDVIIVEYHVIGDDAVIFDRPEAIVVHRAVIGKQCRASIREGAAIGEGSTINIDAIEIVEGALVIQGGTIIVADSAIVGEYPANVIVKFATILVEKHTVVGECATVRNVKVVRD